MLKRLDHIGVLVNDLSEAAFLLERMGLRLDHSIELPGRLKASQYRCGDSCIELIEVIEPVERARRLGDAEARIEHIAIEVDDLVRTMKALSTLGVKTQNLEAVAVDGFMNHWTTAESTDGVVYQLMERETSHR